MAAGVADVTIRADVVVNVPTDVDVSNDVVVDMVADVNSLIWPMMH